jgi:hypothetical protein
MNPDQPRCPLYALVDHRQDGRPRVIAQYIDPAIAELAADLLRAAGSVDVKVELISRDENDSLL